jgi:tetratricopeptide (TPR) repeat protein
MTRLLSLASLAMLVAFTASTVARAEEGPRECMKLGQLRRAASLAETRLRTKPDDIEALTVLARIRAQQKRFDEAVKLADRAVAAAPNDPDAHYARGMVSGMHAQSSSVLKQPGLASRFKSEAEKALAIDPNHEDALEGMVEFYHRAPGIMGGDKKKSAAMADRLVQLNATSGWLTKAGLAFDDKDTVLAERCLRSAVTANGEPRAKLSLASWLIAPWRKPEEAERLAREAVEAEPRRAGGWALLAIRQAQQKRWSELEATLRNAESAAPGNLGPHYQAARTIIAEKSDPPRAEALLRRYLTVEPEIGGPSHAAARWRLGLALEQEGRTKEAIAELEKAVDQDSKLEGAKKDLQRLHK